jgi:hypothetical protein
MHDHVRARGSKGLAGGVDELRGLHADRKIAPDDADVVDDDRGVNRA